MNVIVCKQAFKRSGLIDDATCTFYVEEVGLYRFCVLPKDVDASDTFAKESAESISDEFCVSLLVHTARGGRRPLATMRCITLIPKWMGRMDETWQKMFKYAAFAGFNTVHLGPFQMGGGSNSPYSICNHEKISDDLRPQNSLSSPLEVLRQCLNDARNEYGLTFVTDVVWNHVSCDAAWLPDHPEAGYTLQNSPHLQPAFELDCALLAFSETINGRIFESKQDIEESMAAFQNDFLIKCSIDEHFLIEVEKNLNLADDTGDDLCDLTCFSGEQFQNKYVSFQCTPTGFYRRALNGNTPCCKCKKMFSLAAINQKIAHLNQIYAHEFRSKISQALNNVTERVFYERLAPDGPKKGPISHTHPLIATYFTRKTSKAGEQIAFANNGWIWNADPRINFASESSDAYFLREIIVWEDCIKLRYCDPPEESAWIWEYMEKYTVEMASLFDGIRIDNCHSTPIHVARFLIERAKRTNPHLFVVGELFTDSEVLDAEFVAALGIDCLVREALRSSTPGDFCRASYGYGGLPIGSMVDDGCNTLASRAFDWRHSDRPMALLMDFTHDNPSPSQLRTTLDFLPNLAQVSFCPCPVGSTFGYDWMIERNFDIVNDSFVYDLLEPTLTEARKKLFGLHEELQSQGYVEFHAESTGHFVKIVRERPTDHAGFILVSSTCYSAPNEGDKRTFAFDVLNAHVELVCMMTLVENTHAPSKFYCNILEQSEYIIISTENATTSIEILNFLPGAVAVFKKKPLKNTVKFINFFNQISSCLVKHTVESINELSLNELNCVLFRSVAEEQESVQMQPYFIPNCAKEVKFCGLAGYCDYISEICNRNLMDHPFCANIREGDWFIDHFVHRLEMYRTCAPSCFKSLERLEGFLKEMFGGIKKLAYFYKPKYVCLFLRRCCQAFVTRAHILMGMQDRNALHKGLALTSVQLVGWSRTAKLSSAPGDSAAESSLSAGLPHFATNHMRCWGRDTFVAFKGMFLCTGRVQDAKQHLLAYASCYWRGCIPNLLDSQAFPRYNSRDATWWFVKALQEYCQHTQDYRILHEPVSLRFPLSGKYVPLEDPDAFKDWLKLGELLIQILKTHYNGILYVEHNAGPLLDHAMQPEGFEVEISTDPETGFVSGGNRWNCGTWMDKMGDSHDANTFGVPATPRNGAAIEIVALVYSGVAFADSLFVLGHLEHNGFEATSADRSRSYITFHTWAQKIKQHFEKHFFVPQDAALDAEYGIATEAVRRRGIYRDVYKKQATAADYELRPNFVVAAAEAPDLFDADHLRQALGIAQEVLMGPLGLKTLDPAASGYCGTYNNDDSSGNPHTARGFNYHCGPEWTWLKGKLIKALLSVGKTPDSPEARARFAACFVWPWVEHLRSTADASSGLPELTNAEGGLCEFSCFTQAWSSATVLEALLGCDFLLADASQ